MMTTVAALVAADPSVAVTPFLLGRRARPPRPGVGSPAGSGSIVQSSFDPGLGRGGGQTVEGAAEAGLELARRIRDCRIGVDDPPKRVPDLHPEVLIFGKQDADAEPFVRPR